MAISAFHLFILLASVIILGKILARVLHYFGQPPVIGEMLAGILLGPTIFGVEFSRVVAPAEISSALKILGEIGVLLYLFAAGIEVRIKTFFSYFRSILFIAIGATILPLLCGIGVGFLYIKSPSEIASQVAFLIFLGLSLSITAFPVLARIINEVGLRGTHLSMLALGSAAFNDLLGWILIAIFVVFFSEQGLNDPKVWFGASLFVVFFVGVMIPNRSATLKKSCNLIEHRLAPLLLPAFFALTGLRTDLGLALNVHGWLLPLVIILAASLGKFVGAYLCARLCQVSKLESTALGILLNTRGLMELIVLNLGYDLGVLPTEVYSILVGMTIVTTLMTGPLLWLCMKNQALPTRIEAFVPPKPNELDMAY